jgi:enterochelin esterase-like enzyme
MYVYTPYGYEAGMERYPVLYLLHGGGGDEDALAFANSNNLDAALTRNGMEHTFFVSGGGHTWANWRIYLNTFDPSCSDNILQRAEIFK